MQLAAMRNESSEPQFRARAGRLDKWREMAQKAREDLKLPLAPMERIMLLCDNHASYIVFICFYLFLSFFT